MRATENLDTNPYRKFFRLTIDSDRLVTRDKDQELPPGVRGHESGRERNDAPPDPSARELYESNLELINAVIRKVASHNRLSEDETDEFWSDMHLKLLKDDLRVLREYKGAGSLQKFIVAVASRELLDRRIRQWGKWRPSNRARKMGPLAVLFERLVNRDRLSVDDAIETLRTNYGVRSDDELEGLVNSVARQKPVPKEEGIDPDELSSVRSESHADHSILLLEQVSLAARVQPVFTKAFAELDGEDRLLFRMFYERGFSWAQIARVRGFDQQRVYRFKERVHRKLRAALDEEGVSFDDLERLLEHDLLDIRLGGASPTTERGTEGRRE